MYETKTFVFCSKLHFFNVNPLVLVNTNTNYDCIRCLTLSTFYTYGKNENKRVFSVLTLCIAQINISKAANTFK